MSQDNTLEIVELVKKLVRFKTIANNPEELRKCVDFVQDYFKDGFIVKRHSRENKPSLVVQFTDTKCPDIFLVAHLDVVPAKPEKFKPVIKEDRLYARGAIDNKTSAAILMKLMKDLKENKPSIGLMFTTDEEIGGANGVKYLLEKGYSSKFAIVLDGGEEYNIITKEKAALHLKIMASGKAAHGSRPWEGENAIENLIELYNELKIKFPDTTEENRWKNTINIGFFKGGSAINKLADKAEIGIDMRFISNKDKEKIKKLIKNKGFEFEILTDAGVMDTNQNNKYIKKLQQTASEVANKQVVFDRIHGATDARHFADRSIPAVMMLPNGGGVHAEEEYVNLSSIDVIYKILKDFVSLMG
ncbi:MAG: putative metallohydrolase [Candidatus Woesearchaeota archaeon]|nr:putative metallohydrolase [Candidatus Woesearchaeota archaeon]